MILDKCSIIFHAGNCLNVKMPYPKQCRDCLLNCPHDAISEKMEIDNKKCTECGACMSVCPSDGFVDKKIDDLRDYLFNSEEIVLNCPQAKSLGYEISCIGMLDKDAWIVLMLLAEQKKVSILTGDCGKCDDRQACVISVSKIKEIKNEWPDHPKINIQVMPDLDDREKVPTVNDLGKVVDHCKEYGKGKGEEDKEFSRREAFLGLRKNGKEKVKSFLPSIVAEEIYPITKTRQWLSDVLKNSPDKKIPFKALKANDKCTNCGVCAKICPQKALSLVQKDGKIRLIYEALKCVQCNRCVDICGPEALKFDVIPLSYKFFTGKILLRESVPRYCSKCGRQIFHNAEPRLCMACAAKDPSLKGKLY